MLDCGGSRDNQAFISGLDSTFCFKYFYAFFFASTFYCAPWTTFLVFTIGSELVAQVEIVAVAVTKHLRNSNNASLS
jgi:hypothetical protein